jgi:hypothetical protein
MRQRVLIRGGISLLAGLACVAAAAGIAAGAPSKPSAPSVTPTKDIVGAGLIDCVVATGEVGYSPATISGGTKGEKISIWFQLVKCKRASSTSTPLPVTVVGSISFNSVRKSACPQLGYLGEGVLNLSYNFPGVPNPMIDPSVAPVVKVTQVGPYWELKGLVTKGSYKDPASKPFFASFKPDVIAPQSCRTGIDSEYIIRAQTPFIINI